MSKSMYGPLPKTVDGLQNDWATELAPYGERRLKVIWDISNKCNLRCRMCHFSFDDVFYRTANYTSPALFERSAASVLPLAHTLVLSAANEPLISPHFIDILRIAARYSVPELLFLTNGQLLSAKIADAILETGVTQVQISIDGATKETYEYIRRGAQFDRLVRNLEYLSNRKRQLGSLPRLQFNVVLMQRNLEELHLFVDLAEKVGVEWIAARHLLVMSGLDMEEEALANDRKRANLHFQRFLQRVERSKTVTVIDFPDFFDGERPTSEVSAEHDAEKVVTRLSDQARRDEAIPEKLLKQERKQGDASRQIGVESASKRRLESRPMGKRSIAEKIVREIYRIPRNFQRALVLDKSPVVARSKRKKLALLPFGSVDHPAEDEAHANNAIQIEGWALDRKQIARVTIEREPFPGDRIINYRGLVELGEARILNGSRPDVGVVFPLYPHGYRAGWSFELRREMISTAETFRVVIHAVAQSVDGRTADIGQRVLSFSSEKAKPYLFCSKPFNSLFIDSKADVRPYPDCRIEQPFGSLAEGETSLRDIWFGKDFRKLRQRIIDRDPPPMCLTCAYFINRNVDDPEYFRPR